ncbi:putative quinol monooxygenase [Kitasatospora indigofera]|uniref:putative quinol monooxygenase n=1 Tax=Kitasatospora indigofera TaxID=67307 RepID=UPI003699F4BE
MKKTLLAEFTVKPGFEERVAALVADFARTVRSEPGNLAFDVYTKESDPRAYWIFEVYRSEAAFAEHIAAPHGGPFNTELVGMIEEDESILTFLTQPAETGARHLAR